MSQCYQDVLFHIQFSALFQTPLAEAFILKIFSNTVAMHHDWTVIPIWAKPLLRILIVINSPQFQKPSHSLSDNQLLPLTVWISPLCIYKKSVVRVDYRRSSRHCCHHFWSLIIWQFFVLMVTVLPRFTFPLLSFPWYYILHPGSMHIIPSEMTSAIYTFFAFSITP